MNKIRKVDNKYQVLYFPHFPSNSCMELVISDFTYDVDNIENHNYKVMIYDNIKHALSFANRSIDIKWNNILLLYMNAFVELKTKLEPILEKSELDHVFYLMNSEDIKNKVFDTVIENNYLSVAKYVADIIKCTVWVKSTYHANALFYYLDNLYDNVNKVFQFIYLERHLQLIIAKGVSVSGRVYSIHIVIG